MIYYGKTLSSSGPKLTAVHITMQAISFISVSIIPEGIETQFLPSSSFSEAISFPPPYFESKNTMKLFEPYYSYNQIPIEFL